MKLVVNRDLCEANGMCVRTAPDMFKVDDADVMHILVERPEGAQIDLAKAAVRRCPRRALSLVED